MVTGSWAPIIPGSRQPSTGWQAVEKLLWHSETQLPTPIARQEDPTQDAQTGLFCLSGSSGLSGLTKQTRQTK